MWRRSSPAASHGTLPRDSSILIAAERRGRTIRQTLEQVRDQHGEVDVGLSVISIAELMHGAYRARTEVDRRRRLDFIERLQMDIPIYSLTLETARAVGRVEGEQAARGITLSFEDLANRHHRFATRLRYCDAQWCATLRSSPV